MTLGECINNYLNDHDLSMRKFAALSGVSHSYISNLVSGKNSRGKTSVPSLPVYAGIAKAMGIQTGELIAMVDDKIAWGEQKNPATDGDGLSEVQQKLINLFPELTESDFDVLLATAQAQANSHKIRDAKQ